MSCVQELDKSNFSHELIKEYQTELYETYGVLVSAPDAELQLRSLTRSMFPIVLPVNCAESREQGARKGAPAPACAGSLSATIAADDGNKVGASITPTLGQN